MNQTLEEYLQENYGRNVIDHSIRCYYDKEGKVCFYIHPSGVDGNTLDFKVNGNELTK